MGSGPQSGFTDHSAAVEPRGRAHAFLLAVVAVVCAAAIAGVVLQLPSRVPDNAAAVTDQGVTLLDGRITALEEATPSAEAQMLAPGAREVTVTAELSTRRDVTFTMVDETGATFAVGQRVRIAETEGPDGQQMHYISDIRRELPLLILAAIFLVAVLAFGRWQGLRALVGLAFTLGVIVLFAVPAVLAGQDPIMVALSAAVVIMVVTLYLTHGVGPKTTAAVVGTLGALAVTAGLSWLFIDLASLTGLASEEARLASLQVGGLSLRGLLLAGIIVGALGVLDDVTMAQSSTVFEFRAADASTPSPELFSRAMRVGRDHVAATINTLFLAYAGASLPLLILFSSSPDPLNVIVSSEVVAIEIVRTLVGSIGLMASVPLTTMLAAWLARQPASEPAAHPVSMDVHQTAPVVDVHQPERGVDLGWRAAPAAAPDVPHRQPAPGAVTERRSPASDDRRYGQPVPTPKARPAGPRPGPVEAVDAFADAKPFSAEDEAESEWERRLRESYGLDRLRTGRGHRDDPDTTSS
ncbi:MAG TPA: YibE/F family protein [Euzebyales bacterium]|nr:YibE/F family protein [Euzebyales bacterium]